MREQDATYLIDVLRRRPDSVEDMPLRVLDMKRGKEDEGIPGELRILVPDNWIKNIKNRSGDGVDTYVILRIDSDPSPIIRV